MVETLNNNENQLDQQLQEAISGFRTEESDLYKDIFSSKDDLQKDTDSIKKKKIQKIEKLWKNKVRFPYESNQHECSLILERRWDKVFVKLEKIPTYMWELMTNEFKKPERKQWLDGKEIDASSSDVFLKWLWNALNNIIGGWRPSAEDKAEEAYKLLWFQLN